MSFCFGHAGFAGVIDVAAAAMRPAVCVMVAVRIHTGSPPGSGGWCSRRSSRGSRRGASDRWVVSDSVHSTLVAGLACGHVEAAVLICKTEKCLKGSQSLGVIGFLAPFATGFGKHACCVHVVIAHAHGCSIRDWFSADESEGDTIFKLREQDFNGRRWLPHHRHSCFVVIEFTRLNFAIVCPKVSHKGQGGHVSESCDRIVKGSDVDKWDGLNDLVS